jgi:YD repeat-containing protein
MIAIATTREASAESVNLLILLPGEVSQSDASHPSYVSDLYITTWHYCPVTGLLTAKTYADGKGPTYTYNDSGQLATRAWARFTCRNACRL